MFSLLVLNHNPWGRLFFKFDYHIADSLLQYPLYKTPHRNTEDQTATSMNLLHYFPNSLAPKDDIVRTVFPASLLFILDEYYCISAKKSVTLRTLIKTIHFMQNGNLTLQNVRSTFVSLASPAELIIGRSMATFATRLQCSLKESDIIIFQKMYTSPVHSIFCSHNHQHKTN